MSMALAFTVIRGLARSGQVGANRLGLAVGSLFLAGGAGHGYQVLHLVFPGVGETVRHQAALRSAYGWPFALADLVVAGSACWYWSVRRVRPRRGPALFDDVDTRRHQALQLNADGVQRLVVARYALDTAIRRRARQAIETALRSSRRLIGDLLGEQVAGRTEVRPGDLVRDVPATTLEAR
jgi:hypothetical protein